MLALFDTNQNALRKHKNLNATQLYYSLISDFIEREQSKYPSFKEKTYENYGIRLWFRNRGCGYQR